MQLSSIDDGNDFPFREDMAWAKPLYTRNQVDNAGKRFVDNDVPASMFITRDGPWEILNNWRSSHSYPLNAMQKWLRRIAKSVDANAVVSQRLKRIESIERKLGRFSTLQLSQMQDIAGCRAVVDTAEQVYEVVEKFKSSRAKHVSRGGGKDYIAAPKPDGYRGVHMIYQFGGAGDTEVYNKHRVEIQIRSRDQHSWATSVETVGTACGQNLKSGEGDPRWLRFFTLMSSAIALGEGHPPIPGVSTDVAALRAEVKALDSVLFAPGMVQTCNILGSPDYKDAHYFLIRLDPVDRTLVIATWGVGESQSANAHYTEAERKYRGTRHQIALVSAQSIAEVKRAYPNYFGDTVRFSRMIEAVVHGEITGGGWGPFQDFDGF